MGNMGNCSIRCNSLRVSKKNFFFVLLISATSQVEQNKNFRVELRENACSKRVKNRASMLERIFSKQCLHRRLFYMKFLHRSSRNKIVDSKDCC